MAEFTQRTVMENSAGSPCHLLRSEASISLDEHSVQIIYSMLSLYTMFGSKPRLHGLRNRRFGFSALDLSTQGTKNKMSQSIAKMKCDFGPQRIELQ